MARFRPARVGLLLFGLGLLACGSGKDDDDDDDDRGGRDDSGAWDDGLPGDSGTDSGTDSGGGDGDDDGLTDAEEAEAGTYPDVADSDGDGTGDGDEIDGNTDPLDETDAPYLGGWPKDACRGDVDASGYSVGDIGEDFALIDQNGETVRLHDFCDHYVYLIFAAFW